MSLQVPGPARMTRRLSSHEFTSSERQRMERSLDQLDSILRGVQRDWPQTTGALANPLDIALPLLDTTSVGLAHRHEEFEQLKGTIEEGLRVAVNEHFQSFNDSIGSYRNIVQSVANATNQIAAIEERINSVGPRNDEEQQSHVMMASLNENLKTCNEMIEILGAIEKIKNIPTDLETAMSEKNYTKAQLLIQQVHTDANQYGLWDLKALSNLKEYFEVQEEQLFEILIEEIHNILYSKRQFSSFNTVNELIKSNAGDSTDYSGIEEFLVNSIETDIAEASALDNKKMESFIQTLTAQSGVGDDESGSRELSTLQELNPFVQLKGLMTTIYRLGKLTRAADILVQRFGLELTQMINRVADDTKLRHTKLVKLLNSPGQEGQPSEESYRAIVAQDLFWNFFKKLLFFLQSVKVFSEVYRKITGDYTNINSQNDVHNINPNNTSVIYRFWSIVHKEVESLIRTYITGDDTTTMMGNRLTSTTSIKGPTKKALFQFYQVEYDSFHTNQLKTVLQDLFPGFINSNDMLRMESPYIEDTKFLKQTKIIPADIMNMRYILEPFLLFIQGSSHLLPENASSEPVKFFTDFMQSEFLPLLEDCFIAEYFNDVEAVDSLLLWEPNADFQSTQASRTTKRKMYLEIFIQFKEFIDEVLFTLNTTLQFRTEFIPIIFGLLTKFQDKIEGLYKELINDLTSFLEPNKQLINAFRNGTPFTSDMISARNKVEFKNSPIFIQLEAFHNSLHLLIDWFDGYLIKKVDLNKTDLNLSQIEKLRKNWFFFKIKSMGSTIQKDPLDIKSTNKLILNDALSAKFGDLVNDYKAVMAQVDSSLKVYQEVVKTI
ncbi:Exocyst complex component SEC8 [Cyberlindnera fabianii]|uniref:Exocyst complex component Sec8 n=1 Tax=Cyberlindnera fabianii TaxID=36022 RepID=A0A1V2LB57_CYBFA|nr:Exocyst complex component SEC8 [Cyberlindnera fabianii]